MCVPEVLKPVLSKTSLPWSVACIDATGNSGDGLGCRCTCIYMYMHVHNTHVYLSHERVTPNIPTPLALGASAFIASHPVDYIHVL